MTIYSRKSTKKERYLVENYTLEELQKATYEKECQLMRSLNGKKVHGFLLSVRTSSTSGDWYDYVYADKSISGNRCLIRLGKVFSLEHAKEVLETKLQSKLNKNLQKWGKFKI